MLRDLPEPCVCQMMPPSRARTRSLAALTLKYWFGRHVFLNAGVEDHEVVDNPEKAFLRTQSR